MTSRDFCYWLMGWYEINGETKAITIDQSRMIKNHLNLVFKHEIDLSMPDPNGEFQNIHDGKPNYSGESVVRC